MKVFELMQELSKLPAGADVIFSSLMTVEEFIKDGIADEIDDKAHYHIEKPVVEVDMAQHGNAVFLYSN